MVTSYALLGTLSQGPSYGYDLKRRYDGLFGKEKPLAFGQIYATLSRLLRDNKITAEATEQLHGPERKKYAITSLGREDLEMWLNVPEKLHPNTQTVLYIKVVTAILLDESPNDFLDAQRASHIARMRELTEVRRRSDMAQSLQVDYAIFHFEADLRWIDLTSARLQMLTKEVRSEG
jgi:DNA-binding PadR family transcriptional regulator